MGGCTRLWSPHRRRWLTHPERAAAMGFPVYQDLAEAARVPLDHAALQAPASSLGNAMHMANVGVVVAVAACVCYSAGPTATPEPRHGATPCALGVCPRGVARPRGAHPRSRVLSDSRRPRRASTTHTLAALRPRGATPSRRGAPLRPHTLAGPLRGQRADPPTVC